MTALRQRMLEELQRHNYSKETIRLYLFAVKDFARHFKRRPDALTQEHMREFQLYLLNERKLTAQTVAGRITALRFFFVKVLRRPYQELDLVYPKLPDPLPTVLSETLSPRLLEVLRDYWRWRKPQVYLFPSLLRPRPDKPITCKTIWYAVREAARRAGIKKKITPHTLRHSWATHLLERGTDLKTIQMLLGHVDLEATTIYLHLSQRHLQSMTNPVDTLSIPGLGEKPLLRRLKGK